MYKTSVYILVNGNIFKTSTSKTAKITKDNIIQQHIDTQSMRCGQYHLL